MFLLFSDVLLWCVPPSEFGAESGCQFVHALPLQHIEVHTMGKHHIRHVVGAEEDVKYFSEALTM